MNKLKPLTTVFFILLFTVILIAVCGVRRDTRITQETTHTAATASGTTISSTETTTSTTARATTSVTVEETTTQKPTTTSPSTTTTTVRSTQTRPPATTELLTSKIFSTLFTTSAPKPKMKSLGVFRTTVYIPDAKWGYATSTGERSKHLQTCAVDPNVIPLYSTIYVNGLTLLACDIGNLVQGKSVDIFYDGGYSEAMAYGENFGDYNEVFIIE